MRMVCRSRSARVPPLQMAHRVARQLGYGIESVRSWVRQGDSIHVTYQAVAVAAAASPRPRHAAT